MTLVDRMEHEKPQTLGCQQCGCVSYTTAVEHYEWCPLLPPDLRGSQGTLPGPVPESRER